MLGEGVAGIWFVLKVPFYTVLLQTKTDVGNYLADAKGMTLYYFTRDSVGKSTATAAVLANWPIFNPASFVTISTLNTSDFGTITRDDGQMQATYKGWPLYYFAQDKASGDTSGAGLERRLVYDRSGEISAGCDGHTRCFACSHVDNDAGCDGHPRCFACTHVRNDASSDVHPYFNSDLISFSNPGSQSEFGEHPGIRFQPGNAHGIGRYQGYLDQ